MSLVENFFKDIGKSLSFINDQSEEVEKNEKVVNIPRVEENELVEENINNENIEEKNNIKLNEPKEDEQHKIVTNTWNEMNEKNFTNFHQASLYWESLSLWYGSVWFKYDIQEMKWKIINSYGTQLVIDDIIQYVIQHDLEKVEYNANNNNNNNHHVFHPQQNEMEEKMAQEEKENKENNDFLTDFLQWAQKWNEINNIEPIYELKEEHYNDNKISDIIISDVWSSNKIIYLFNKFEHAFKTWESLGLWYASVWFVKQQNVWVVHNSFGTNDQFRNILHYVNDWQRKCYQNHASILSNNNSIEEKTTKKIETNNGKTNDDEKDDNQNCIVCMESKKEYVIIPCGHICLCQECVKLDDYKIDDNDKQVICPICRTKATHIIKTYL